MRALASPDSDALRDLAADESSTFSSFSFACDRFSHLLFRELKVDKGDRVAVLSPPRKEYLQLFFAAAKMGAVFLPLPETGPGEALSAIVRDTKPAALFHEGSFGDKALALRNEAPDMKLIDFDDVDSDAVRELHKRRIPVEEVELFLEDPLLLIYDPAREGRRGVILSHGAVMWNAMSVSLMYRLNERDRAPLLFPMSHPLGLTLFTIPLFLGGGVTLTGASAVKALIDGRRCGDISFLYLEQGEGLESALSEPEAFPSLRFCACTDCAGSPARQQKDNQASLVPLYCLAEAGPHSFHAPPSLSAKNVSAVGQPMPHVEAVIMDQNGKALKPGHVGELMIRGHHIFSGYWNCPSATRAAFHQGWLRTGDMARCDSGIYQIVEKKRRGFFASGPEKAEP